VEQVLEMVGWGILVLAIERIFNPKN
jgi:hypothetical protein